MRVTVGNDVIGDYSPDGTRIVFLRDAAHGRRGSLAVFTVNTDGTGLRQITPGMLNCCSSPSWSPDGTEILFGSARGKLFAVHPDGTDLSQIPIDTGGGSSFAFQPGWSPDGTNMVFSLFLATKGQVDVYTARADGTHLVQVTNTPEFEEAADWGPHPLASESGGRSLTDALQDHPADAVPPRGIRLTDTRCRPFRMARRSVSIAPEITRSARHRSASAAVA
jgi:dipeptidyl aminopeptidase/acylaminoacyl peptidase